MEQELTLKDAIDNIKNVNSFGEKDFEAFDCLKDSQKGIFVISNIRMSFVFYKEDKISYIHMFYDFVNKIKFNVSNDNDYIETIYEGEKERYYVPYKIVLWEIKKAIDKYIPEKTEVIHIKESTNVKIEIEKKKSIFEQIVELFNQDKIKDPSEIGKELDKSLSKSKYVLFIFAFLLAIITFIFTDISKNIFTESFNNKFLYIKSFSFNFLKIARCEQDMTLIIMKLNIKAQETGIYPDNITKFIKKDVKESRGTQRGKDPWGNEYILKEEDNKFKLISPGPDLKVDTYDDLVKKFDRIEISKDNDE